MTEATPATDVVFNPLQPGFAEDPYPHLAELRQHDPVHESLLGPYILFRYDDVFAMLRDPEMSVDDSNADATGDRFDVFTEVMAELGVEDDSERMSILGLDPPDHTRLRRLVSKAFTPRMIEEFRPRVEQLVDEALDAAELDAPWDLIEHLAFPLPFQVISDMLGMPEGDRDQIRGWSHALTKTLDPVLDKEDVKAALLASQAMDDYLEGVVAWKREHPADDLLTGLIHAEEDGDRLSHKELIDQVVLLFIAGHETTVNLIGNGTYALLGHRAELERLRDDPDLDPVAVEELLRYDPPVQTSRRITLRPVEIDGVTIPANRFVLTSLASANRDPAKWGPTADELDLTRDTAGQHLSFGSGAHYCLGASLAKLEGSVAIGRLIRRFPDLDQAGDAVYNGRLNLRGLAELPLDLNAG